jgi:hypothetical protein
MNKIISIALIVTLSLATVGCSTSSVSNGVDTVKQNAQKVADEAHKINEMLINVKNVDTFKKYKEQVVKVINSKFNDMPGFKGITANNVKFAKVKDRFGVPCFGASVDVTIKYTLNNKEQSKTENIIVAYDFITGTWRILDGGSLDQN